MFNKIKKMMDLKKDKIEEKENPAGGGVMTEEDKKVYEKAQKKLKKPGKRGKTAKLEGKIEELEAEKKELKDKYLRVHAEFQNYRKRAAKERVDTIKYASEETLSALLPVLDDFDRAIENMGEGEKTAFQEGVILIHKKMKDILKQRGLVEIVPTGEVFDSEKHNAIAEIPAPSAKEKGVIVDTVEKGYALNDKVIRFPKVVVGK